MNPERYQLSSSSAEKYEQSNVPLAFGPWAKVLVERSSINTGDRVLDVACGTGIVARTAAPVAGPSGRVVGCDLNDDMLAEAAKHVAAGLSIDWQHSEAEQLVFDDESFDVVFCQQALQYVPDRGAAVSEMCRVLRPGGEAVVAVWRGLDHNPIQRTIRDCLSRHLSPEDGSLFNTAFASDLDDPEGWTALFTEAGFDEVTVEQRQLVVVAADARERMTGPFGGTPIAGKLEAMDPDAYEAMVADTLTAMAPYIVEGRLEGPTTVDLVIANKQSSPAP